MDNNLSILSKSMTALRAPTTVPRAALPSPTPPHRALVDRPWRHTLLIKRNVCVAVSMIRLVHRSNRWHLIAPSSTDTLDPPSFTACDQHDASQRGNVLKRRRRPRMLQHGKTADALHAGRWQPMLESIMLSVSLPSSTRHAAAVTYGLV